MTEEVWVEVRDEPRHRQRFENDYARAYDVRIPPGDLTLYHRHTEDTLYVSIHAARVRNQTWGEAEIQTNEVPAGIAICAPHRAAPLTHQVGNVGEGLMRMIGVEAKRSPALVSENALEAPGHALQWENARLRTYLLELEPGASTGAISYAFSGISIALEDGDLALRSGGVESLVASAPGDLLWHDGPRRFELENVGGATFRAYVTEWR